MLAGGASLRMGRDKAGLVLPDGRTWLERQVGVLREAGAAEVVVAAGGREADIPGVSAAVADVVPGAGPLAGLAAVLSAARSRWVVVLAVDLPCVTASWVGALVAEALRSRVGVVPGEPGAWEPLAAAYPVEAAAVAAEVLASGERRLWRFVEAAVRRGLVVSRPVAPDERELLRNANAPEDLRGL